MNPKRIISLLLATVIIVVASGCSQQIYGVKDAIENAEARGDMAARDDHFESSLTMLAKGRTYGYRQLALYDLNNHSLGIISRGADDSDITIVYIPDVQAMLAGKEDIHYDLYYLALLGPVNEVDGTGTAVLMADDVDSAPVVVASVTFTVPEVIRATVNKMDIGNKTLACPVYDSAVAEQTYGGYEVNQANIDAVKKAKRVSDIDLKKMRVQKNKEDAAGK